MSYFILKAVHKFGHGLALQIKSDSNNFLKANYDQDILYIKNIYKTKIHVIDVNARKEFIRSSKDLSKLPLQQLDQLKNQLAQEINVLQESMSRLKMVQQSFVSSDTALDQLKLVQDNKPILVPLTGSLYVPGKLVKHNRVMVDIGTGYYVQKSVDEAKKYFEKKIGFLTKQMEQLQPILQQKVIVREEINDVFQQRVHAQLQAQKAAAGTSVQAK